MLFYVQVEETRVVSSLYTVEADTVEAARAMAQEGVTVDEEDDGLYDVTDRAVGLAYGAEDAHEAEIEAEIAASYDNALT